MLGIINRLSRIYPEAILDKLIYEPSVVSEDLLSEERMQSWIDRFTDTLNMLNESSKSHHYKLQLFYNKERNQYLPQLVIVAHGVESTTTMSADLFESEDYKTMRKLGEEIGDLIEEGAHVTKGERVYEVDNFKQAFDWIIAESKKGYNIQRYKGLGEMNPEQLWETPMDANNRRMLKVTVEDAIAADQIFTCLMGDNVEPRREFIETNALSVANLDV